MRAPVIVRETGIEAGAAIAALEAACFDAPWSIADLRSLLDGGLARVWTAGSSTDVVGAAVLRIVAGEGELLRIAVHPERQRQGVGRALLRAVLSAGADACPLGVHLEVRASNGAARRLYEREGFVEQGRRRDYYGAPREDAVLMHWRPAMAVPADH